MPVGPEITEYVMLLAFAVGVGASDTSRTSWRALCDRATVLRLDPIDPAVEIERQTVDVE